MTQKSINMIEIEEKTQAILEYLQNDDGCWGELKTQSSRITNTCEAVWCFSFFSNANRNTNLHPAIELIKKGVLGKNLQGPATNFINCEIPRDYGWALIALTSIGVFDPKIINHTLSYIEKVQAPNGGFCTRDEKSESLFNSAIVAIGLIGVLEKSKPARINRIKIILSRLSLYFISSTLVDQVDEGEFSYAYYAMSLMKRKELLQQGNGFWNELEKKALCISLHAPTQEKKSRDAQKGVYRPYRHFTNVWILLAFIELDNSNKHRFARKLLSNYSYSDGWTMPGLDYGLTWVNSIAFVAIAKYLNTLNPFDFILNNSTILEVDHSEMTKVLPPTDKKKIFIVHGHDELDLTKLQILLSEKFGLNPVVAKDHPSNTIEPILHKIRRLASSCYSAIILLTPDDLMLKDGVEYMQARPNVILEIGICIEKCEGRVIFLRKQGCELFSDIGGLIYIGYNKEVKEAYSDLQVQLKHFGVC